MLNDSLSLNVRRRFAVDAIKLNSWLYLASEFIAHINKYYYDVILNIKINEIGIMILPFNYNSKTNATFIQPKDHEGSQMVRFMCK